MARTRNTVFYVIVHVEEQKIIASTSDAELAEAERLAAEQETGEAHEVLPASQKLAENFSDWTWHTKTVVLDGKEVEMAIIG